MPEDIENLLRRLIGGDETAPAAIRDRARTCDSPRLLVAAALITDEQGGQLIARAQASAASSRDRQLVAVAAAHLDHNDELLDALVRDHLADHPDNLLAAWIAAQHR